MRLHDVSRYGVTIKQQVSECSFIFLVYFQVILCVFLFSLIAGLPSNFFKELQNFFKLSYASLGTFYNNYPLKLVNKSLINCRDKQ